MVAVTKIPGEGWVIPNCYVVHDDREAVVVDPGCGLEKVKEALGGKKLLAVLLTHGHFDHIAGATAVLKEYGAPLYAHQGDAKLIKQANLYVKLFGGKSMIEIPQVSRMVKDGEELDFGFLRMKVIHTPGHTEGSVCYHFGDNLITGDLLMKNTVGRTDLPGGDKEKIRGSLMRLLEAVPEAKVLPGHNEDSTMAEEKKNNPKLSEVLGA